jgi:hypothetical protein
MARAVELAMRHGPWGLPEPSPQVGRDLCDHLPQTDATGSTCLFPNPLLEARAMALGAMRRLDSRSPVKLNPRNFLCPGRATALFA